MALAAQLIDTGQTGFSSPAVSVEAGNGTCIQHHRGGGRDVALVSGGVAGGRIDLWQGAGVVLRAEDIPGKN